MFEKSKNILKIPLRFGTAKNYKSSAGMQPFSTASHTCRIFCVINTVGFEEQSNVSVYLMLSFVEAWVFMG